MADLYKGLPANYGGFDSSSLIGGSGSAGYYQKAMGLPFMQGRSILATIPEYQRNPLLMEKDLMIEISEGRLSMMRTLLEFAERNGTVEVNDVRFRLPVKIVPNQRFYITATATSNALSTTFTVSSNKTKIKTAHPQGNIKQTGDIARLEVGQFIMLMFSWVTPARDAKSWYGNRPMIKAPVPEICKITAIDYDNAKITVDRNWAGERRTTHPGAPGKLTVGTTSTTASTSAGGDGTVALKDLFFLPLAKSMQEDEIDAKIHNYSGTWAYGMVQRHLRAWGEQHLSEVVAKNLGLPSMGAESKKLAIEAFYKEWEWTSIFSEKSEDYDAETGFWSGTTDGLLTNIPADHYINLLDIDYNSSSGIGKVPYQTTGMGMGSFHPQLFNKLLEEKGYIGSQDKILLCGGGFHTSFATMINIMTQNLPDIKSEWKVEGKRFMSSNGLNVNVVPSDVMSLNGLSNTAILFDPSFFKIINLKGYPTDIFELQNENPLKKNGFIHAIKGFIDLNPDAHWVFNIQPNTSTNRLSIAPTGSPINALL